MQRQRPLALEAAEERHLGPPAPGSREQLALVGGQRSGDRKLELAGGLGIGCVEPSDRLRQGARVPAEAAEATGVDQRDPLGIEQPVDGGERLGARVGVRVPGVGDDPRGRDAALPQVGGGGLADADDLVGGAEPAALEPAVEAMLQAGRERLAQRLEGPGVADVGDPADAAPLQRATDGVGRLRGRGREDAVELLAAVGGQRRPAGERRPGDGERLGHDHLAERVRLAGVAVGVEERVDAVMPGHPRPPGLHVEGPNDRDALDFVGRLVTERRCGQHGDPPPEPRQILRHRRRSLRPGVAGGWVEVGDEQKRTGAAHAGAPSFSCLAAMASAYASSI